MAASDTSNIDLPNNISTRQNMVRQLLSNVNEQARQTVDWQNQLDWFKRHAFGRRSEKLDPNQLTLFEAVTDTEQPEEDASEQSNPTPVGVTEKSKKHRNGHRPLPARPPRERIEYHPSEEELIRSCCGQAKQVMGEEVSEELDYVPASFVVRQHVRVKYVCKHCQEGVVIADLPARPIEKGRPGTGLSVHVLTGKYCDHSPVHRQEGIFKRHGVDINRSTMCDWVRDCAHLLSPIVHYMKQIILESKIINTDDTPVPVPDGSRTQIRKGYLWVYIGDKRTLVFDYTPTHSRDGPVAFLGDHAGYVQADAYQGYDAFFDNADVTEVGCWAHTRRKSYDARITDPGCAHEILAMIGKICKVEQQAEEDGLDAIGRRNWPCAGSDAGVERAAIIYSLAASCKLCRLDPFAYLRDVLDRVSTHPANRISELTPSGWKRCLAGQK